MSYRTRLVFLILFAAAFAFVEAAVVIYLRALYYPEGFTLILKHLPDEHVRVELWREASTLVMLATVAFLAGRKSWDRFGNFALIFGAWDIFFYVWLKVCIDWPASFGTWDVLFLIPVPWVAPVWAPIAVSAMLVLAGLVITKQYSRGGEIRPTLSTWLLALAGTALILFSFMRDAGRIMRQESPAPYLWWALVLGLVLYGAALWTSLRGAHHRH